MKKLTFTKKGFTLIELLIVIAILGTLAVVVLLALNPVQQLAAARDGGRSTTLSQLGHAVEAHATATGGAYNADGAAGTCAVGGTTGSAWVTNCLVNTGEIKTVPGAVAYSSMSSTPGCGAGAVAENGFCYDATTANAVVYVQAEATRNTARCATGQTAYFVYSTAAGRGGLWCGAAAPAAGLAGSSTGWQN